MYTHICVCVYIYIYIYGYIYSIMHHLSLITPHVLIGQTTTHNMSCVG